MEYIENKYYKTYYKLINNIDKTRVLDISEKHHIIPKSLGGSDLSENIVVVTPKEHYILHHLLTKFTLSLSYAKMIYAFSFFVYSKKHRLKITSVIYDKTRREVLSNSDIMIELAKRTRLKKFNGSYHGSSTFNVWTIKLFNIDFNSVKEVSRIYEVSYKMLRRYNKNIESIEKFLVLTKGIEVIEKINKRLKDFPPRKVQLRESKCKNTMQIPIILFNTTFVSILKASRVFKVNVKTFYRRKHDIKLIEEYILAHRLEILKEVIPNACCS
jgi:hypothetical protein